MIKNIIFHFMRIREDVINANKWRHELEFTTKILPVRLIGWFYGDEMYLQ